MNLHHRPLFLFTIVYICGIVCAVQSGMHILAVFAVAGGLFLAGCAVPANVIPRPVVLVLAAFFAVGFVRAGAFLQVPLNDVSQHAEDKLVYLTGTVASDPEPLGDRTRFVLKANKVGTYTGEFPVSGQTMVTLYQPRYGQKSLPIPSYGEIINIHGRLRKPQPASYPGAMDYGKYLVHKRIFCTLFGSLEEVRMLKPAIWSLKWIAVKFKTALTSKALQLFPPVHAMLLIGILLGDYASLPSDVQVAFMRSGTMHLLVASGYNCGVVIGIFGFLMRRVTSPRKATHWLLIALIWMFALIVGPGPSILRAAVMVTAFLAAYLFKRAPDMINIVFFSCLVILGANPLMLYDVGFQLSFAAVLAIVLILPLMSEPPVSNWFIPKKRHGRRPLRILARSVLWSARHIVLAVAFSLVVFLGNWPITAYYFNYLSTVSPVANALVAVLVVALTAAGIAVLSLGWIWSVLGHIAAPIVTGICGVMLGIVTGLGMHPWSSVSVRSPSPVFNFIYYLVLLGVLEYVYRKTASVKTVASDN